MRRGGLPPDLVELERTRCDEMNLRRCSSGEDCVNGPWRPVARVGHSCTSKTRVPYKTTVAWSEVQAQAYSEEANSPRGAARVFAHSTGHEWVRVFRTLGCSESSVDVTQAVYAVSPDYWV